jgi:hypothetical protein
MDAGMQKHRIIHKFGNLLVAFLLIAFHSTSEASPTIDSIAPLSLPIWSDGNNNAAYRASTPAGVCSAYFLARKEAYGSGFGYVDLGYTPESTTDGICTEFCDSCDIFNRLQYPVGAYLRTEAVCPSALPPYTYIPDTQMCVRPAQQNLTITLSGGTSVEPWHKKADTDHKKTNLPYTATVKDASGQPAPNVEVTVMTEVTQDSGGHVHVDGRHKGKLAIPSDPIKDGKETITGNTDINGAYSFTFGSEEVSGTHTLTAKCSGCQTPAIATVKVEIQGLSLLDRDPLSYTLNGEKSWHPGSHYFSAAALAKIINLAHKYSHDPAFNHQLLIINDSSLIKGGVFDLGQDWTYEDNGHQGHRVGVVVDVNNYSDGPNSDFEDFTQRCCKINAVWEGPDVTSTPHYHLWLLGKDQ